MMTDFWRVARAFGIVCLMMVIGCQLSVVGNASVETDKTFPPAKRLTEDRRPKTDTPAAAAANTVRSLVISGNNSFSDQHIRALMRTDVWSTYDETVMKADFAAIIRFYQENGYQFARIVEEQLSVKKFKDGIYLGIEIDEGSIGKILVSGNIQTKEEVIRRELLFAEGISIQKQIEKRASRFSDVRRILVPQRLMHSGMNSQKQLSFMQVLQNFCRSHLA